MTCVVKIDSIAGVSNTNPLEGLISRNGPHIEEKMTPWATAIAKYSKNAYWFH